MGIFNRQIINLHKDNCYNNFLGTNFPLFFCRDGKIIRNPEELAFTAATIIFISLGYFAVRIGVAA